MVSRQDRTYRGYELLVQNVKGFEEKLLELDAPQLSTYFRDVSHSSQSLLPSSQIHQLRKGSGASRGDDAANLKPTVAAWIGPLFDPTHTHPPISPTNKSERGFEHEVTGRLLCPIEFDWNKPG